LTLTLDSWTQGVVRSLRQRQIVDFAGLGIIFYRDRANLPVHPLVSTAVLPNLPATGIEACADLLADISRRSSPCHDGFVLVRTNTKSITEVSQFLAPPIPATPLPLERTGGARRMAARLASLLDGVDAAVVSAPNFDTTLFELGVSKIILI
jgi:hypothetical protein